MLLHNDTFLLSISKMFNVVIFVCQHHHSSRINAGLLDLQIVFKESFVTSQLSICLPFCFVSTMNRMSAD